jgi:hypothetical protein
MVLQEICPPALIYLIFSTTQVVIDTTKGYYNLAMTKMFVALIFTMLLNYLCSLGLGIISWLIVFIPFILMTLIVSMLLLMFGLDPTTGKLKILDPNEEKPKVIPDARQDAATATQTATLIPPVSTSVPEGVYVDSPKNGKDIVQPATAKDTKKEMDINKKIKLIVDQTYSITKNQKLSQYILTTLQQCTTLSAKQCSQIWMVEVLPMMNNTLGKDQTDKLLASLLNIFLNEGYSAANTIGEIIVGNNNSAETPSEQTQNVLNDMKMKRSGATSLNYYK